MAWDYLDDTDRPSSRTHYFADSDWKNIGVQIDGKRESYVRLSREEWKKLNKFLARYDFDPIKPEDYAHFSEPLRRILDDYVDTHNESGW